MPSKDLKEQFEEIGYTNLKRLSKKKDKYGSVVRTFSTDQGDLIVSTGQDDDDYPYGVTKVLSTPFSPTFPRGWATFCMVEDYEYDKTEFSFFAGSFGYDHNDNGGDHYDEASNFIDSIPQVEGTMEWTWGCKTSDMTPQQLVDLCYNNGIIFVDHVSFQQDEPLEEFTEIYKDIMNRIGQHFYYYVSDEETIHVVPIEYWNQHKDIKPNYDGDQQIIEWLDYVFPGYNMLKRNMEIAGVIDDMSNLWTWNINSKLHKWPELADAYLSMVGMVKNDEFSNFIEL